ncbi:MAG: ABC transporter permease subunit [Phycisphaeraceae bacterium]|nr:ABC transporter permease subunit [Phycisphaeraceae bacterium]
MQPRPLTWWIVMLSLLVAGGAISAWLWLTDQRLAAIWVNGTFDLLAAAWLAMGLWRWRSHPVAGRIGVVVAGTATAALLCNIFIVFERNALTITTVGVWAMSIGFYLALQLARRLLSGGWPVLGVARTLLDEAVRLKAVAVLLVMLFILVPCIPLLIDPTERLTYRVQQFLTYSLIGITTLLSLLTIVVAVTTITRELEQRQIFLTMSKPVSRGQYLLGKWLGMAVLNALLVAVCGVAIYTFTMLLAQQPATMPEDARELHEQVLVARQVVSPRPQDPAQLSQAFSERLATLRQQEPQLYGQPGEAESALRNEARDAIQKQVITAWFAVSPRSSQTYVFRGLTPARQNAQTVQFRLKPKSAGVPKEDVVYLALRFNNRNDRVMTRKIGDGKYHVIEVPTELIDDKGDLSIEIYNPPREQIDGGSATTINFNTTDGLQLLYRVDSFEANLTRAMILLWLRLCFLGMLALATGTFLGFPVAALLATLICVAASGSSFLNQSLSDYAAFPKATVPLWDRLMFIPRGFIDFLQKGEFWNAFKLIVALIGSSFMKLVPGFSEFSPTQSIAYGLHLPFHLVGRAALWLGVIWTGATGIVAWLIFRARELARVQV